MENIPSIMVLHKNVDGTDNRFTTMTVILVKNTLGNILELSEKEHTRQHLKTANGNMNQCQICGNMQILAETPAMTSQVMKEEKISKTLMIRNRRKWYQFHVETQEVSDRVTKEDEYRLKVTLKYQSKSSFSLIPCLQGRHILNGTWCRWIWTSLTLLP